MCSRVIGFYVSSEENRAFLTGKIPQINSSLSSSNRIFLPSEGKEIVGNKMEFCVLIKRKRKFSCSTFELSFRRFETDHTVRHPRCVFINYNWINQLSNTTIWWLDIYVVYYIGINYMFRL